MSNISKDIRANVRSNSSIPGVIIDLFYGKASVRLANNGAVYRNLDVVGGPVAIGQQVRVDFTTSKPTVVATGVEGISLDDIKRLLAGMETGHGNETQITITLFSGGAIRAMYPSNGTGFAQALSDANDGDVVFLPDVDIDGDFTIPAGVNVTGLSRQQSIVRGTITLSARSVLQNVAVILSANEMAGQFAKGVILNGMNARVDSCFIYVLNTGNACGVYSSSEEIVYVNDSLVYAYVTQAGVGYSCYRRLNPPTYVETLMRVSGGTCRASTHPIGEGIIT